MKALIVEDEALVAKDLAEILTSNGYEITDTVASVSEALKSISQNVPNIILLDIRLSGTQDGIDLAHELNDLYQIPFIYITAHTDRLTFERARASQPAAYLTKPFKEEDVFSAAELAIQNHLNHSGSAKTSSLNHDGFKINKVRAYIIDHMAEKIKLSDLAQVADMNVYYFSHHFKNIVGISPYQYVIDLRLEKSEQLLAQGNENIAEIAFETGFSSQSQFNKHFKKKNNITPAAYRKLKI